MKGTLLYIAIYGFLLIPFQSFSKFHLLAQKKKELKAKDKKSDNNNNSKKLSFFRQVKYYNSQDLLALMGDRAVGNVLEQALVFLPLFWLHALFVDPTKSFQISLIYSMTRAIYPVVFWATFSGSPGALGISTVPGYLVTMYLFYQVLLNFVWG